MKNNLLSSYCSNLYLCSLWANYRKSSISRFIVSYNNAFRILHYLHMRCSASSMFANAVVDSCSTCIMKSIFSLMSRLNKSSNVIVQSTRWVKALYQGSYGSRKNVRPTCQSSIAHGFVFKSSDISTRTSRHLSSTAT